MLRSPLRLIFLALAVIVLAGAGFAAWYVFADDAPSKPSLPTADGDAAASDRTSPDGTWVVAPGKDVYVGYRMKEQFAGELVKKDAVGRTPAVTGSMTISGGSVTATKVTADVRQLDSGRAARDTYLHANALETDRIHEATFELTTPVPLGNIESGEQKEFVVSGNLTLHDVTRPVQLTVDARWNGGTIDVAGTAPISLADYAISTPKTPVVSTEDNGSLELQLVFHAQ